MDNHVELKNVEIHEFCMLNKKTGEVSFYKTDKKTKGFTGLYFKEGDIFLAIYPSKNGPAIFFEGNEYEINKNLSISLLKQGKNREFNIDDYNIKVNYMESQYINFDEWSDEIDVDLFLMIAQNYKEQSFYDKFTLKSA